VQACYLDVGGIVGEEEDRPVEDVVWVEDLGARKAVPPGLAVAVYDAGTVDFDVPWRCQ
jgi:hypothetical protein